MFPVDQPFDGCSLWVLKQSIFQSHDVPTRDVAKFSQLAHFEQSRQLSHQCKETERLRY